MNDAKKIKKADIVADFTNVDPWFVGNKRPDLEYRWGRKSDDIEMSDFAMKGYIPANGKETIIGNPLENSKCGDGQMKIRGDRILMCCPKHMVNARREKQARQYVKAGDDAKMEARSMARKSGLAIESDDSSEVTSRSSIDEPAN
ncbi:MAG: hypothetical protein WC554_00965 [Clostridia bacterium]|jgi:hypothetical protein